MTKLSLVFGAGLVLCTSPTVAVAQQAHCPHDSTVSRADGPQARQEAIRQPNAMRQPRFENNKPMQKNKARWT